MSEFSKNKNLGSQIEARNLQTGSRHIYLISPPKIDSTKFLAALEKCLSTNLVSMFQLRLKGCEASEVIKIAKKAKKICHRLNCKFIVNDSFEIAKKVGADGVHVGSDDGEIAKIRESADENFIIGTSCYDSKILAAMAEKSGASYVSFGAFFPSKTKLSKGKPTLEILTWARQNLKLPVVAIGGIDENNYQSLLNSGADHVAIISAIWEKEGFEAENLRKFSAKS